MDQHIDTPEAKTAAAMAGDLRVIVSKIRRRMREARPGGFTGAQLLALSRLEREGPLTVTALARAEGVRPQSMGATVGALEEAGLVKRSPDPTDGRQSILSLTASSKKFIASSRAARNDWLMRAIQTTLSAKEQEQLAKSLKLLRKLIDA